MLFHPAPFSLGVGGSLFEKLFPQEASESQARAATATSITKTLESVRALTRATEKFLANPFQGLCFGMFARCSSGFRGRLFENLVPFSLGIGGSLFEKLFP